MAIEDESGTKPGQGEELQFFWKLEVMLLFPRMKYYRVTVLTEGADMMLPRLIGL